MPNAYIAMYIAFIAVGVVGVALEDTDAHQLQVAGQVASQSRFEPVAAHSNH